MWLYKILLLSSFIKSNTFSLEQRNQKKTNVILDTNSDAVSVTNAGKGNNKHELCVCTTPDKYREHNVHPGAAVTRPFNNSSRILIWLMDRVWLIPGEVVTTGGTMGVKLIWGWHKNCNCSQYVRYQLTLLANDGALPAGHHHMGETCLPSLTDGNILMRQAGTGALTREVGCHKSMQWCNHPSRQTINASA